MATANPKQHPQYRLRDAAKDLFLQAYGALRYGSHAPTRMQWLALGAELEANGASLPADWAKTFAPEIVERTDRTRNPQPGDAQ